MVLRYYDTTKNFGDLLNPLIFSHYLPEFFDGNPKRIFLGIGTILGLLKGNKDTNRILVFSSGYAPDDKKMYGEPPVLDEKYEFYCVRGPLTAKALKLDPALAISDGALLLKNMPFMPVEKEFECAYMPHHVTEGIFEGWKKLMLLDGIHYISPQGDPISIIEQIRKSKLLITEAMHGAIVADVFRVPWIPVKSSAHINQFKWDDWAMSLGLEFSLHPLKSLFGDRIIRKMLAEKFKLTKYQPVNYVASEVYKATRQKKRKKAVLKELRTLRTGKYYLSDEKVLDKKIAQLTEKLKMINEIYSDRLAY